MQLVAVIHTCPHSPHIQLVAVINTRYPKGMLYEMGGYMQV